MNRQFRPLLAKFWITKTTAFCNIRGIALRRAAATFAR